MVFEAIFWKTYSSQDTFILKNVMLPGYMCINGELLHVGEYGDYLLNTIKKERTCKYSDMTI